MFLELSGVLERLQNGLSTQVLEIGFGLGLNCLLTADAALNHRANLEYHAFEHDLVTRKALESLGYRNHLSCPELVDRLHTGLFEHAERGTGVPAGSPAEIDTARHIMLGRSKSEPTVDLTLLLSDATANMWPMPTRSVTFDAIYLDAFSPDTNTECWTEAMLSRLFTASRPDGGTLTTYCAKGVVRRRLEAIGFAVTRHPGPPGKREVLTAKRLE